MSLPKVFCIVLYSSQHDFYFKLISTHAYSKKYLCSLQLVKITECLPKNGKANKFHEYQHWLSEFVCYTNIPTHTHSHTYRPHENLLRFAVYSPAYKFVCRFAYQHRISCFISLHSFLSFSLPAFHFRRYGLKARCVSICEYLFLYFSPLLFCLAYIFIRPVKLVAPAADLDYIVKLNWI